MAQRTMNQQMRQNYYYLSTTWYNLEFCVLLLAIPTIDAKSAWYNLDRDISLYEDSANYVYDCRKQNSADGFALSVGIVRNRLKMATNSQIISLDKNTPVYVCQSGLSYGR